MKRLSHVLVAALVFGAAIGATQSPTVAAIPSATSPMQQSSGAAKDVPPAGQPAHVKHAALSRHRIEGVQVALQRAGETISTDGFWGPETEAALKQFQTQHHLRATGRLDHRTREALQLGNS